LFSKKNGNGGRVDTARRTAHDAWLFYRSGLKQGAKRRKGWRRRSVPASDEIPNLRVDLLAELASAEDSVVADTLRQKMLALFRRDVSAQDLGRLGLAVA